MDRLVALVDMDCFYCQVEARLNPSLKGKPMAVVQYNQWKGGGIIAVNYEARDQGVTRHMRGKEAKQHCPEIQLVSVPAVRGKADLTKYRDAGREVIAVICEFSECVQRASVDEAYIDLTAAVEREIAKNAKVTPQQLENTFVVGYSNHDNNDEEARESGMAMWLDEVYSSNLSGPELHRLATAAALVEKMRAAVFEKTGFRCSAGIAHNKILAKLVCGLHKPNRQTVLPMSSVPELYSTLPVKKVRNLGGKFGDDVVDRLGITYMGELVNFTEKQLQAKYDDKTGTWLYNIARGIDLDPVTPRLISKSIGCCKKFPGKTALATKQNVTHWLSELASEVAERLDEDINMNKRKAQLLTVHFSQEVGRKDVALSRSVPLPGYDVEKLAECAYNILNKHNSAAASDDNWYPPLKYLGLSAGKFSEYSGNTKGAIDKFFKTVPPNEGFSHSKNNNHSNDQNKNHKSEELYENIKTKGTNIINGKSTVGIEENTGLTTNKKSNGPSFFEKYFKNLPDKIINSSPIKQENVVKDMICQDDKNVLILDKKPDEIQQMRKNTNHNESENLNDENEETEETWISPSEIFPDMENIDDSIFNILPSPLQRKISSLKNITHSKLNPKPIEELVNDLQSSSDSGCTPTIVEAIVDIHPSPGHQNLPSTSTMRVKETFEERETGSDDLLNKTSIDIFEQDSSEEEKNVLGNIVFNQCSYCKENVPLSELQEHLDHHVALELQEEFNKQTQSQVKSIAPIQIRNDEKISVLSGKKKRGRPSKKDASIPKKARTIISFFTKS